MGCCASEKKERTPNMIDEKEFQEKLDAVFRKYDRDRSGALDYNETCELLADAFKGTNQKLSLKDLQTFVKATDKNADGKIQKHELYDLYKRIAAQ
jgi:Ca2+-binding EF-hand superfamily protein